MMLKNKIAVITGSTGIGLATLIKFSENGADIIVALGSKT